MLYYLYRRKNKLYLSIVKQNQEAIKRETELNRRIKELETNAPSMVSTSEKYASSSLTDEKSLELFRTLERIMREEKIYKDNFITKDKVAEILGTNRTYLSRIINEQSKLSFTHYVNRFRIEEAIRLLSDPNNETPMKAISAELGFNSISTFYNLFQSSVGMTPSQYRNKSYGTPKKSNRLSFCSIFYSENSNCRYLYRYRETYLRYYPLLCGMNINQNLNNT